jgi:hypothetical protein
MSFSISCDSCEQIIISELDSMPDDIDEKLGNHTDVCDGEDED